MGRPGGRGPGPTSPEPRVGGARPRRGAGVVRACLSQVGARPPWGAPHPIPAGRPRPRSAPPLFRPGRTGPAPRAAPAAPPPSAAHSEVSCAARGRARGSLAGPAAPLARSCPAVRPAVPRARPPSPLLGALGPEHESEPRREPVPGGPGARAGAAALAPGRAQG